MKRHAFADSLRRFNDLQSPAPDQTAERPKLSCTRATLSVFEHASAVIAVYILFQRITKYIFYRFKVTGSLHFASNLQYSPALASVGNTVLHLCVRLSLEMFAFGDLIQM